MAVNLTRVLVIFSVFCMLARTAGTVDSDLVKRWATHAGNELVGFFNTTTNFSQLQEEYNKAAYKLSVRNKNGTDIVRNMASHLQDVLQNKIKSIQFLADKTAAARHNYTYNPNLKEQNVEYLNSKDLPTNFSKNDPQFSTEIDINKSSSVVHIPVDVYSGGIKILNTIMWTKELNTYFKENEKEDPSLLWQYFGSSDGVYRVYPGFKWRDQSEKDDFDSRRRGWYIQGSSSPKDIILLLDLSGSMAGQKLSIIKLAAMSLLETLQENDFVNIVVVYSNKVKNEENEVKPYMVCQVRENPIQTLNIIEPDREKVANCSNHLLQATQQNKKYLKYFVPKLKARGIAAISKGFEYAIEVLKRSREKGNQTMSSDCMQAIILFTDGIEESQTKETNKILEKYNSDKKIRVFTYLVGREKSSTDQPLKTISGNYGGCAFNIQTLSDVREKVLEYVKVLSRPVGFATAKTGPDPSWTPIYLDKLGLGLMITLVAPVFNKSMNGVGELLGVVGTDVALPQLEGTVPSSEVGVGGYGFAINNNGFVLFHPGLDNKKDPPNIALDQLEYNTTEARKLMREMIDRKTGSRTFENRLISKHKHRIGWSEKYHYFYSPINGTSFSAAVAIPESSLLYVNVSVPEELISDLTLLESTVNNESVVLAPWKICSNTPVAARNTTPVYQPAYPTAQDIINDDNRASNCDSQKLQYLFFDANITKMHAKWWNEAENARQGIDSVFVATQGGIMRWLTSSPDSSKLNRDFVNEEFYTRAAQFVNKTGQQIIFSARYRNAAYKVDDNSTVTINASSAVVVTVREHRLVVAVAGMQVNEATLRELLFSENAVNTSDSCNDSSECAIRVIDDDGFIVASNQDHHEAEVGKSFAEVEATVMQAFLNRSLFEGLTFNSVQEDCKKSQNTGGSSSARTLLNPLFAVTAYVQFWTQTIFWSLAQFNIYSFFSHRGTVMAEDEEGKGVEMIPCTKELKFYKAILKETSFVESVQCDQNSSCERHVYVEAIPNTNLRLVVAKTGSCPCENEHPKETAVDVTSNPPLPVNEYYRQRPDFPCHDGEEQGKPPCALASLASPHYIIMVFLLILTVQCMR